MSKDNHTTRHSRDARVLELYEELLEIEQRLIPTGLHILGQPSGRSEKTDLLKMIAAFDRPESKATALPDLVAQGLGLSSEIEDREKIDSLVKQVIHDLLANGVDSAVAFLGDSNVDAGLSRPMLELLSSVSKSLDSN